MAELKYFTPILKWLSVVADERSDVDADPQVKGIFAGCTVIPTIAGSDARAVRAEDLTPAAALLALAPFEARLDDGRLMLRADSDKAATSFANVAAFPGTGATNHLYRALDTDLYYEWTGTEYVLSVDYARLRLLANCPVLELPDDITIWYEFRFHHVTYNGASQALPTITIAAPTIAEVHDDLTDGEIVVNLATSEWIGDLTPVGGEIFVRNVPDDVGLVGDDVQFYRQGIPLGDPLDLLITGVPADIDDITDATAVGKAVVRATDAAAARAALGIAGSGGNWERYANFAAFPPTGNTALEYLAEDTNNLYTWNGSSYALVARLVLTTEISDSGTAGRAVVQSETAAAVLGLLGLRLTGYDHAGVVDGAAALQAAVDVSPVVVLTPGSTLFLNSPVFLDSVSALGNSIPGTYIIDGQGTATIKLGSGLPTTAAYTPDTTCKWGIHLNTERTALSGGVVTHSDGTRSTGSGFPSVARLIIRNCLIDGAGLNAGLVFSNTAATIFDDCVFTNLKHALSWRGYTDGSKIRGGQNNPPYPAGQWLIDQIYYGDGILVSDVKGERGGVWRAQFCNGGHVRNMVNGMFSFNMCESIIFDGGHWECDLTDYAASTPIISVSSSQVTLRGLYAYADSDSANPFIEVNDTDGVEGVSNIVIDNPIDVHFYHSAESDPTWLPYLHLKTVNTGSTVELRRPTAYNLAAGETLHAGSSFTVAADQGAVQTALADGRFASTGGVLTSRSGAWEVITPSSPGVQVMRTLAAPGFIQALANPSASVIGTLSAATYQYVMALVDTQGRYTTQSAVLSATLSATGAIRLLFIVTTTPARVVVWRKSGTGVQAAPDAYAVLPVGGGRFRFYDTGTHIDGVPWITSSVPIPNTVAASNATVSDLTVENVKVVRRTTQTVTTTTTLGASGGDYIVFIGASGAPALPTAVSNTGRYAFKNTDSTNRTISTTSSQTIDGTTTLTLPPGSTVELVSDGSNWRVF